MALIAYSLVGQDDGAPAGSAANGTVVSTTRSDVVIAADPTTVPGTAPTETTAPPVTTTVAVEPLPTTAPPITSAPAESTPTSAAPPTTASGATVTTRRPVVTSPPPTAQRFGSFCGFIPGAIVDIDVNGRNSGNQAADGSGCVVVNR